MALFWAAGNDNEGLGTSNGSTVEFRVEANDEESSGTSNVPVAKLSPILISLSASLLPACCCSLQPRLATTKDGFRVCRE